MIWANEWNMSMKNIVTCFAPQQRPVHSQQYKYEKNTSSFNVNFQAQLDINIEHWKHINFVYFQFFFSIHLFVGTFSFNTNQTHITYPPSLPCVFLCGVFVYSIWQNTYYIITNPINMPCLCMFGFLLVLATSRNEHRAQNCVISVCYYFIQIFSMILVLRAYLFSLTLR